ncbi:hypothetical protein VPH35_102952 [Triticum aestivum]
MEPHLSNSPMAPAGANEVSPRPDLPRPQRAFRIRAVVELDPRPPRHTMANVLKATSTTMTRRRRRMTRTCTTPHPGLTSLKRRSPSPTSSSTMTVSSIPTTPTRDRRSFPSSLLYLPHLVYCLTTEQDVLFSSVIYIISALPSSSSSTR